jgi:hypothetical protein
VDAPRDGVVGILGAGIGEQLSEGADIFMLAVDRLHERPQPTLGGDEMIDVLAAEARRVREVADGGLAAVHLRGTGCGPP